MSGSTFLPDHTNFLIESSKFEHGTHLSVGCRTTTVYNTADALCPSRILLIFVYAPQYVLVNCRKCAVPLISHSIRLAVFSKLRRERCAQSKCICFHRINCARDLSLHFIATRQLGQVLYHDASLLCTLQEHTHNNDVTLSLYIAMIFLCRCAFPRRTGMLHCFELTYSAKMLPVCLHQEIHYRDFTLI